MHRAFIYLLIFCVGLIALQHYPQIRTVLAGDSLLKKGDHIMSEKPDKTYPKATYAGGCFWCLESEFRGLDGVLYTRVGYIGGELDNPGYKDITTGKTGHAEAVEVTFDPDVISYETLTRFFFTQGHDPTQLNRQGVDVGTQYRSAIFPLNKEQEDTARSLMDMLNQTDEFNGKIVTTLEQPGRFWEAEDYHQQYYEKYKEETGVDHIRVLLKKKK